jgi:hypothetical protein
MRKAGEELFEVLEQCARKGRHPVSDLLAGSPTAFTRWEHYPEEPVADERSGSSWFYHAHEPSEARRWEEHGHFHCFASIDGPVHLAAISIESSGVPTRLFATNRWVTNESLHPASEVAPLVDRFSIRADRRFALTSRWLSAMLRLFQPQIEWLLHERDRLVNDDESIEILAVVEIDLDRQLDAVRRSAGARSR